MFKQALLKIRKMKDEELVKTSKNSSSLRPTVKGDLQNVNVCAFLQFLQAASN